MDARLKEIAENLEKMKRGLDDTFKFHCTECGKCCINREDILLTARDVYNMSKELSMKPEEMIRTYCEWYIGEDSRFPIVRIRPRGSIKRCPLLKDHKCSVHQAKPGVCAMFPIGRLVSFKKEDYKGGSIPVNEIQYILQPIDCGDDSETFTVREYLEMFGIPVDDPFFFAWQSALAEVSNFIRGLEKKVSVELMNTIWMAVFVALYLSYDTERPFMPQFIENKEKLLEFIHKLPQPSHK